MSTSDSAFKRFWKKVDQTSNCWWWRGAIMADGYGNFWATEKIFYRAHRFAFEWAQGREIIKDLQLDHLCRNRRCVNPAHLEEVDCRTNLLRGETNATTTHCPAGHAYDFQNTYKSIYGRKCRACHRIRATLRYQKRKCL